MIGAGLAVRVDFWGLEARVGAHTSAALVTLPVAALLAALWAISIRLHDSSIRTWLPFGIAIVACGAATFWPAPELATGLICVALLVTELRLTGKPVDLGVIGRSD